jgi:hypothetical protein
VSTETDATLTRIEQLAEVTPASYTDVDFAAGEPGWADVSARLRDALRQLWLQVANCAWVDTKSAGQAVAYTAVGYGGQTRTLAFIGANTAQCALHAAAVTRAIDVRASLFRIAVAAVRTAASLSAAASSANPLLALSAARNGLELIREIETASRRPL